MMANKKVTTRGYLRKQVRFIPKGTKKMKEIKQKKFLIFLILFLLSGCAQAAAQPAALLPNTRLQAWVDKPLDRTTLTFPVDYELVCHGADPSGVKALQFSANETILAVQINPDVTNTLFHTTTGWQPGAPGEYTIACRAQNDSGQWSADAIARVKVEAATPTITPTITPTVTPTITPTVTPTITPTPPDSSAITFTSRVSTARFQYQRDCVPSPAEVTITATLSNTIGVKYVFLFFRLESAALGATTAWNSGLMMTQLRDGSFTRTVSWRDTLAVLPAISGSSATFVYQFVAVDASNNTLARSQRFYDVMLSPCN